MLRFIISEISSLRFYYAALLRLFRFISPAYAASRLLIFTTCFHALCRHLPCLLYFHGAAMSYAELPRHYAATMMLMPMPPGCRCHAAA